MAQVLIDSLVVCDDCAIAIANDDYSGLADKRESAVRTGIKFLSQSGYIVLGDELGFSHAGCDCCMAHLGGNKHQAIILVD